MTTSYVALEAFKRAVSTDQTGSNCYPSGAVFLSAECDGADFIAAIRHYDPAKTPVVIVRDDGAELVISIREPRGLFEKVAALIGRHPLEVDIRAAPGTRRVYHSHRIQRPRAGLQSQARAFAGMV